MINHLNTAEWLIVGILSFTLFVFLVLGIILIVKLPKITKQAKKIVETSQAVADKADDIADNLRDMTSVGLLTRSIFRDFISERLFGRPARKHRKKIDSEE